MISQPRTTFQLNPTVDSPRTICRDLSLGHGDISCSVRVLAMDKSDEDLVGVSLFRAFETPMIRVYYSAETESWCLSTSRKSDAYSASYKSVRSIGKLFDTLADSSGVNYRDTLDKTKVYFYAMFSRHFHRATSKKSLTDIPDHIELSHVFDPKSNTMQDMRTPVVFESLRDIHDFNLWADAYFGGFVYRRSESEMIHLVGSAFAESKRIFNLVENGTYRASMQCADSRMTSILSLIQNGDLRLVLDRFPRYRDLFELVIADVYSFARLLVQLYDDTFLHIVHPVDTRSIYDPLLHKMHGLFKRNGHNTLVTVEDVVNMLLSQMPLLTLSGVLGYTKLLHRIRV